MINCKKCMNKRKGGTLKNVSLFERSIMLKKYINTEIRREYGIQLQNTITPSVPRAAGG